MEATAGPPLDMKEEPMSLEQLGQILLKNEIVAPSTIDAIEYHARKLGSGVCALFQDLNNIVDRHESVIRKRWIKKSVAQRREVLLTACPDLVRGHQSDMDLEVLTKTKPLLIFLNARGRSSPWNFACSEEELTMFAKILPCTDEASCKTTTINFTRDPNPDTYGTINRNRALEDYCRSKDDHYEICARAGTQILYKQQCILSFLVNTSRIILHDLSEEHLFRAEVQIEPPLSDVVDSNDVGHTSFSDVLAAAPYRGWHSLNFSRLRGYVYASLDMHKDHIRALREDPSYLADTILEYEEHAGYRDPVLWSLPIQQGDMKMYRNTVLRVILEESYSMFAGWTEINCRLAEFEELVAKGASMHDQRHAAGDMRQVAEWMKNCLALKVGEAYLSSPNIRKLFRQDDIRNAGSVVPKSRLTLEQNQLLDLLVVFRTPKEMLKSPTTITHTLEMIDRVLRKSPEAKDMMSVRLMSLLTDISVLGECLRHIHLWESSPNTRKADSTHIDCNYRSKTHGLAAFNKWHGDSIVQFRFPQEYVYPFQEKLRYPAHERRTLVDIETMRDAESNLDKFWAAIDAYYERTTGVAQHELIRKCLEEGGPMYRTPTWIAPTAVKSSSETKPEYGYELSSRTVHNKTLQMTGAFNRLSVDEKIRPKTGGAGANTADPGPNRPAIRPAETHLEKVGKQPILVDQRARKVFRTLLNIPTSECGDLPKSVKWVEFKRAMARAGFSVEKLQGSAWQFAPGNALEANRSIQFHEPHPDSDIPYIMAKRFGRRLARVYGWSSDTFELG